MPDGFSRPLAIPGDTPRQTLRLRRGNEATLFAGCAAIALHGAVLLPMLWWTTEPPPRAEVVAVEITPILEAAAAPAPMAVSAPPPDAVQTPPPEMTQAAPPPPDTAETPSSSETVATNAPSEVVHPDTTPELAETIQPPPPPKPRQPHPPRPLTTARPIAKAAPAPAAPTEAQTAPAAPAPPAPAPVPTAPAAASNAIPSWRSELVARLQRAKRYPNSARSAGEQGVATVTFTMDRTGHVLSASLAHSAGSAALDEEATALIRRAEPLPPFPPEIAGNAITLTVPISFRLQQ